MKLLMLGLFLALDLKLSQGEGFTKCTGVNVGLTNICSMLAKMDCYNAGGGCCATYSDGTGTVSVAEKTSEELCGYCFTGEPGTLEATLEAISTAQGKRKRGKSKKRGSKRGQGVSTMQGKRRRGGRKGKVGRKGGKRRGRGGRGGRGGGKGEAGAPPAAAPPAPAVM